METTIDEKHKPKAQKGWLTKTALVLFAALALADLTGCAALQNSANTLGNAAGTQVTKGGLWLMGKDADCHFESRNNSTYSPGQGGNSGTVTGNTCRELPSTDAQIKLAQQQEAIMRVHFQEQAKRQQEIIAFQNQLAEQQRAASMAREVVDTCHRREVQLLSQGKTMDPSEGCVTVLNQEKAKNAELAKIKTPEKPSTGLFSGWTLKN
jgi:hypothetical protein